MNSKLISEDGRTALKTVLKKGIRSYEQIKTSINSAKKEIRSVIHDAKKEAKAEYSAHNKQ